MFVKGTIDPFSLHQGDKVFNTKLKNLNETNYIPIAAEYYHIAFREDKILHFQENSFAKKLYILLTSNLYESFVLFVSYSYLFLSLLEPGNRDLRPYETDEILFKYVITVESFC